MFFSPQHTVFYFYSCFLGSFLMFLMWIFEVGKLTDRFKGSTDVWTSSFCRTDAFSLWVMNFVLTRSLRIIHRCERSELPLGVGGRPPHPQGQRVTCSVPPFPAPLPGPHQPPTHFIQMQLQLCVCVCVWMPTCSPTLHQFRGYISGDLQAFVGNKHSHHLLTFCLSSHFF